MEEMGRTRRLKEAMSRSRRDGDGRELRIVRGLGANLITSCVMVIDRVAH